VPQNLRLMRGTLPVVVISHGLGDTRTNFLDIGAHVASYGFMVAIPEHIGSNHDQKEAMFAGLSNETFKAREFIDRPLDITYLLDELARTNQTDYGGKLNLDQVAVIGHSFGGYTALALAGATIDFNWLAEQCTPEANIVLNAAQLLECRALELTADPAVAETLGQTGVRDPRVKLVLAYAPVSQLFGQSGISRIQIPTMLMGGVFDVVAPAVPQQLNAFRWLTTADKYLYLSDGSSHTADLTRMVNWIFHIDRDLDQGVEDAIDLNRNITKALCVAFAKVYLTNDPTYEPFLRSAYVEAVSEAPFKRHLVRELPTVLQPVLD
ncbi:MAG: alpha/beta hydrolase family protein, partial [Nodosilinea sp.]